MVAILGEQGPLGLRNLRSGGEADLGVSYRSCVLPQSHIHRSAPLNLSQEQEKKDKIFHEKNNLHNCLANLTGQRESTTGKTNKTQ